MAAPHHPNPHNRATFQSLDGQKFGRLTVIRTYQRVLNAITAVRVRLCDCSCDCGKTHTTRAATLINGSTRSCGCLLVEHLDKLRRKTA